MDRRRNARVAAFIPVRLWGMDANSLPFTQMATVKNISSSGVEIHGLMRQVLPGELLDVQLGEDRAQYRVVWAGRMGSRKEGEIGLESIEAEPFIWNLDLLRCSQVAAQGRLNTRRRTAAFGPRISTPEIVGTARECVENGCSAATSPRSGK